MAGPDRSRSSPQLSSILADAPGKLLLLGEYAVLAGAPALVMAIDRRVRVRLEPVTSGTATLSAPQLGVEALSLSWSEAGLQACPGLRKLGMTARLLPLLASEYGIPVRRLASVRIEIDSGELFSTIAEASVSAVPVKLGLGSSGAVTAALTCAFEMLAKEVTVEPVQRWMRCLPHYRAALDADASGADLAASLTGGMHLLRIDHGGMPQFQPRSWPEGLYWRAIWVGKPARTVDYVAAFRTWCAHHPTAAESLIGQLCRSVEALAADGGAGAWLEAFDAYAELLGPLGSAIGQAVLSPPHLRLRALARQHRTVYKSCGAGGGDLGIVLSDDPERLDAFCSAAWSQDVHPLNLRIDPRGASAQEIGSASTDPAFTA